MKADNISWGLISDINKIKEDDFILAEVKHCNEKLKCENQIMILQVTSDGYYIEDSWDQLSYNWDIVNFKKLEFKKRIIE